MRTIVTNINVTLLACLSMTTPALADFNDSAPPSTTIPGYAQVNNPPVVVSPAPPSTTTVIHRRPYARPSTTVTTEVYYSNVRPVNYRRHEPVWVPMRAGEPIPANAVVGGSQYNPNSVFYICRANYRGSLQPGKFLGGNCNIGWGGREIIKQHFEILVSRKPLTWVEGSYGNIPHHAIAGGQENGNPLFICQADYENGTYPGKIIGNNCNFGWGGQELMTPHYNVLTG